MSVPPPALVKFAPGEVVEVCPIAFSSVTNPLLTVNVFVADVVGVAGRLLISVIGPVTRSSKLFELFEVNVGLAGVGTALATVEKSSAPIATRLFCPPPSGSRLIVELARKLK